MFRTGPDKCQRTALKKSDIRKLKDDLAETWLSTDDQLLDELGFQYPLEQWKYSKDVSILVGSDGTPLCFSIGDHAATNKIHASTHIPTLYTVHKAPHIMRTLAIHRGVGTKLRTQTNLFLPGVWTESAMFDVDQTLGGQQNGGGEQKQQDGEQKQQDGEQTISPVPENYVNTEERHEKEPEEEQVAWAPRQYGKDWVCNIFGCDFRKSDLVVLHEVSTWVPCAVGEFSLSSEDIRTVRGMKGTGVELLHVEGDWLWSLGNMYKPGREEEYPKRSIHAMDRKAQREEQARIESEKRQRKQEYEQAQQQILSLENQKRNRVKNLKKAVELRDALRSDLNEDQRDKIQRIPEVEKEIADMEIQIAKLRLLTPEGPFLHASDLDDLNNIGKISIPAMQSPDAEDQGIQEQDQSADEPSSIDHDMLVYQSFLVATHRMIESQAPLPLIMSSFSANYLKPASAELEAAHQADWQLDWKKTKWKKMLAFFQESNAKDVVTVSDLGSGTFAITAVNTKSDHLANLDLSALLHIPSDSEAAATEGGGEFVASQKRRGTRGGKKGKKITIHYERVRNKNRTRVGGILDQVQDIPRFESKLKQTFACQVSVQDGFVILGGHHAGLEDFLKTELATNTDSFSSPATGSTLNIQYIRK